MMWISFPSVSLGVRPQCVPQGLANPPGAYQHLTALLFGAVNIVVPIISSERLGRLNGLAEPVLHRGEAALLGMGANQKVNTTSAISAILAAMTNNSLRRKSKPDKLGPYMVNPPLKSPHLSYRLALIRPDYGHGKSSLRQPK